MAFRLSSSLQLFFFFFCCYFLFISTSVADTPWPISHIAPHSACVSTPYPNFCKSMLLPKGNSSLHDYGRFSIKKSLSWTRKFSSLIDRYLRHRPSYPETTVQALKDCRLLSGLNIDFLLSTAETLNSTDKLLSLETDNVQTLLSAIVTNQQTCLEGLEAAEASSIHDLYSPLFNGTKLYRVSLALFTRAWVHKKKKKSKPPPARKLLFSMNFGRDGIFPLRMSTQNREMLELVKRGRLLQFLPAPDSIMISNVVVVSQDGRWNFTTINGAVAAAPNNTKIDDGYFLIYIEAGVYEEYVTIAKNKKNLMMIGDGIHRTIITGNRSFIDGWTTFNSATFAVVGEGFVAMNLTFCNTAGAAKHQAVALRDGADLSVFFGCSFEGFQDTLYAHSLRQFYRDCEIYGTIDFIFGNAAAVFQNCNIYPRLPLPNQTNALTAQGRTDPNQNTGISIHNCQIRAAPDLASDNNGTTRTYLGRPWKEYSRTVYMQSFMDGVIDPTGWLRWSGDFALSTLYYAEYNNTGAGSDTSHRVNWPGYHLINASDAANFTVSNFILGDLWLLATGVPFDGGLL